MKKRWIAILLSLPGTAAAQQVEVTSPRGPLVMLAGLNAEQSRKSEVAVRVSQALVEIGAPQITDEGRDGNPPPVRWRWVILNETAWMSTSRIYQARSPLAFGSLLQRVTYLRGLRVAAMSSLELKRLLAHELGHLLCACTDQNRADDAAESILQKQYEGKD